MQQKKIAANLDIIKINIVLKKLKYIRFIYI